MNRTQRTDPLPRLACAAAAMVMTSVIGLWIHTLARGYETAPDRQAAAHPPVVALAVPR
jgi:hypothetical protein